jgi:UDP-N-acetylmuramoyl-L-alanyl-D-glutamate--2,6-diaminopimelate ligase
LVDYAHTPDALERVLGALSRVTPGGVCCVFGCGGDRDPDKRPKMGAAVGRGAARAILTSDNPRSEEPAAIAAAVELGLRETGSVYEIELDRAQAIEHAVLSARPGDSVLLAGKGHETYQIVGNQRRPFDDRVEARRALALRRAGKKL